MRYRAVSVVIVAGAVLAGCATLPESRPDDLPAGKVAATDQQAGRALDRYDEVNNQANVERDPDVIEEVEAGPLLETTVTGYRLSEAADEEAPGPFFHTDVLAYSPRFTEYPMWFVATSRINSDPNRVAVQVLHRDSATEEWMVEQAATLGDVRLPTVRMDGGAVAEVGEENVAAVRTALDGVYEYLAGADAPADVDVSAEGLESYRTWAEESTIQLDEVGPPEVTCTEDDRADLRVLPTDGGAFGIVTARCVLTQSLLEEIDGEMTLSGELSALAPDPGRTVEFISSHPLVVIVSDDGAAEVLTGGWRWADVTMSDD